MRYHRIAPIVFFAATLVPAVTFAQQPATKSEIAAAFVGRTARFAGFEGEINSTAKFGADGSYTYMYRSYYDAEVYTGRYTIYNGKICVAYTGGATGTACYAITKDNGGFLWESPGWGTVSVTFDK